MVRSLNKLLFIYLIISELLFSLGILTISCSSLLNLLLSIYHFQLFEAISNNNNEDMMCYLCVGIGKKYLNALKEFAPIRLYLIIMNLLTKGYFIQTYRTLQGNPLASFNAESSVHQSPVLQILGYECSTFGSINSQSQIIIRLSDSETFLDCFLIGGFMVEGNRIMAIGKSAPKEVKVLKKYDIVELKKVSIQYVENRICKIRIAIEEIKKIKDEKKAIGRPSQINQFIDNITQLSTEDEYGSKINSFINNKHQPQYPQHNPQFQVNQNNQENLIENSDKNIQPIKIQDDQIDESKIIKKQIKQPEQPKNKTYEGEVILTGKEIISGKQGLFIGRLLRMKMTSKQTKEGQLSVLISGFVDKTGDLVRINMAGRTAIRQFKELKKSRCYCIKGLQPFQTQKMPFAHIKIKEKEFKISQIQNKQLCNSFAKTYHLWDHQSSSIDSERVDVIGIIDQIDQKGFELEENVSKQVVRITVKNMVKSVKVSFWAEQINSFKNAYLRKNQAILLEDIRKKKNKFLDFTYESSIIRLDSQPQLRSTLLFLLPQTQSQPLPLYISQINNYSSSQNKNAVIFNLSLFLCSVETDVSRLIYKICSRCKRKTDKKCGFCKEQGNECQYKYNSQLQFSDFTGCIGCVGFDIPGFSIFKKTAQQLSQISDQQVKAKIHNLSWQQYHVGIEKKNLRFIIRSIESFDEVGNSYERKSQQNITLIKKYLGHIF